MRCRHRLLLLPLSLAACLALLPGCGGGGRGDEAISRPDRTTPRAQPGVGTRPTRPKLGVGHEVRDCDVVFIGPGRKDWRRHSLWIGPFGLSGRHGPNFAESALDDGLLTVKTPTMVAGHSRVTISIPAAQRYRAGILGVHPRPAYASVTYVPCDDRPRTVFAAGFLLRDRRPLTLLVQIGHGPVRGLYLRGS